MIDIFVVSALAIIGVIFLVPGRTWIIDDIILECEDPPVVAATGQPIISNAAGRRGIGMDTDGGVVPWGP